MTVFPMSRLNAIFFVLWGKGLYSAQLRDIVVQLVAALGASVQVIATTRATAAAGRSGEPGDSALVAQAPVWAPPLRSPLSAPDRRPAYTHPTGDLRDRETVRREHHDSRPRRVLEVPVAISDDRLKPSPILLPDRSQYILVPCAQRRATANRLSPLSQTMP
jgi:hypothetical protein